MPDSFDVASALEDAGGGAYAWTIPDRWQQGRGAFGGLVLGAMMRAMVRSEPDATRIPRALTGDLCGPALVGPARIVVRELRRGKNQSNLAATLEQNGALVAHATAMLGAERPVRPTVTLPPDPPEVVPFDAVPTTPMKGAPIFTQHYEYRPTSAEPYSGGERAEVTGWVRERVLLERVSAAAMIARLDAHWPGTFTVETSPRPMATVAFMAELLRDPAELAPGKPLFYRGRVLAQGGGYFVELRELWDEGVLLAANQQVFALLG